MNPIVFALDFPTLGDAANFMTGVSPNGQKTHEPLYHHIGAVKIGLELFIASGPRSLDFFGKDLGLPVILDLKLHDIPETVARAVKAGGDLGAKFMTLHIQQRKTLEMAVKAAEPFGIQLLGVTVLTSMTDEDLDDLRFAHSDVESRVYALVRFAAKCGITGFVCSPKEVAGLRQRFPESFLLVPGVRPAGAEVQDQKRVGTPAQAMKDGANFIVVGRPIRDATDPVLAAQAILAECTL